MTADDLAGMVTEAFEAKIEDLTDVSWAEVQEAIAHQAEVIAAAGWVKGRKEWGVRYISHVGDFEQAKISEHVARVSYEEERDDLGACAVAVVRRYVSDWKDA